MCSPSQKLSSLDSEIPSLWSVAHHITGGVVSYGQGAGLSFHVFAGI